MGELIRWLWNCVCWVANLLAVPFCILLAVLTVCGFVALAVCIEIEMNKERTKQTAEGK